MGAGQSPETFTALSAEIKSNLEKALKAHARDLESNKRAEKWGLGHGIGSFLVAGGLAAATPAVPLLSIPAALIGLGYGVCSVSDIIWRGRKSRTKPE